MALSMQQKKYLRGIAHHLKPVIIIGQHGLSEGLMNELNSTLDHHELIKIKIAAGEREERKEIINTVCQTMGAELVQAIGKIFVIYRPNPDKKNSDIHLPRT